MFQDASEKEIDEILQQAWQSFFAYRKTDITQRAHFLKTIAQEIEKITETILQKAMEETNLPEPRLRGEIGRTLFQLRSYADACEKGDWLQIRIDRAIPDRTPARPDIRKMQVPLGPVVVFGASNFPFAYSTAGGDTATALAAGCPVVVKAHPAHEQTSQLVAEAILRAVDLCQLPKGVFAHVHGRGFETGKNLVLHPATKAVGFTGSYGGGKQLFDWANQRKEPIPVFSEMGSINPVFLFPEKLKTAALEIATQYAASITLSVGQFCTNPGLIIGLDGPDLDKFIEQLGQEIRKMAPARMLHPGISKMFTEKKALALSQPGVRTVAVSEIAASAGAEGIPTVATASAASFLKNPVLHQEVFGPYSLVVRCQSVHEMKQLVASLEGQLSSTLMATENDIRDHEELVELVKNICGRFILNGVPTGVEVCLSMQHGGPFPATTDSRFTSVGADAIARFVRPLCFQNWPDELLPGELKNANPFRLWRTVNDKLTMDPIV